MHDFLYHNPAFSHALTKSSDRDQARETTTIVKKGSSRKKGQVLITFCVSNALHDLMMMACAKLDTDKSKLIRSAIRNRLAREAEEAAKNQS